MRAEAMQLFTQMVTMMTGMPLDAKDFSTSCFVASSKSAVTSSNRNACGSEESAMISEALCLPTRKRCPRSTKYRAGSPQQTASSRDTGLSILVSENEK
jgi:hypothetical protein